MLFATFLSEFHGATLWHGDAPDLILMAPSPPSGEILQRAQALYGTPRLHDDFAQLGMEEAAGLFGFYLLDDAGLRKFSSGAQINTDDRTLLEYHAPRSLLVHGLEDKNRDAILLEQKNPLPEDFPPDARDATLAACGRDLGQSGRRGRRRAFLARPRQSSRHRCASPRFAGAPRLPTPIFRRPSAPSTPLWPSIRIPWRPPGAWPKPTGDSATTKRRAAHCSEFSSAIPEICGRSRRSRNSIVDFSRWAEAEDLQRRLIAADPHAGAAARAELAEILLREDKLDEAYRAMLDCLARIRTTIRRNSTWANCWPRKKNGRKRAGTWNS